MRRHVALVCLAALLAIAASAGWPSGAASASAAGAGRVVLVLADQISFADLDWSRLPGLSRMARRGSVAMSAANPAASNVPPESWYLTIGNSSRTVGSLDGLLLRAGEMHAGQEARAVYLQRTGRLPPADGDGLIHLGISEIDRNAEASLHSVKTGWLADALETAGREAVVIGTADVRPGDVSGRQAAAILLTSQGTVRRARIGPEFLLRDEAFPGGWRTDWEVLRREIGAALPHHELIVVETGDTRRIRAAAASLSSERERALLDDALARLDDLVDDLLDRGDATVLLAVPTPAPADLARGIYLVPLLAAGADLGGGSLLSSGTTRTPGVVSNLDIAPTILRLLSLPQPGGAYGRPVEAIRTAREGNVDHVVGLWQRTVHVHTVRPILVKGYILAQIVGILWAAAAVLERRLPRPPQGLLLALTAGPLVLLTFGFWPRFGQVGSAVAAAAGCAMVAWLARMIHRRAAIDPFALVGALTALVVLVDAAAGSGLQAASPFGFSYNGGARYYGIGNEYMGVLIGGALSGFRGRHAWVVAAASLFLLASPAYGADLGGTVTAAMAFGTLLTYRTASEAATAKPAGGWTAPAVAGGLVAVCVAWFLWQDLSLGPAGRSHVGLMLAELQVGGVEPLFDAVQRKLIMNLRLMRYTIWSRALLAALAAMAVVAVKPPGRVRQILRLRPDVGRLLVGSAVGSLAALLFNDSGVVASALLGLYGAIPVLDLALRLRGTPASAMEWEG